MPGQIITITLDRSWQLLKSWSDDLGHRMAKFRNGAGDEIVFEVVDYRTAEMFLEAGRALVRSFTEVMCPPSFTVRGKD